MRIGDRYERLIERVGATPAAKPVERVKDAGATRSGAALEVNVSDRAQELSTRSDRVEELKAQIANGTYRVDARAIASRLLEDA